MARPSEPVVVFGLAAALLVASVAPFAVAALQAGGPAASGGTDRPTPTAGPADAGATPTAGSSAAAERTATDDRKTPTPGAAATPTKTPTASMPSVDCGGPDEATPAPGPGVAEVDADGVSVAVIDPGGFDVDDPAVADQVVGTAAFDSEGDRDVRNDGVNRHGTVSARTVARMAPSASLYLANFRTAYDFTRAVEWAVERDVDVIVAPTVFYAKPNDGSAPVSRAVSEAAAQGVTVVVPTGNAADRHWEGITDGGTVEFAEGDTRMYLEGDAGRVNLWLWWNRSDDAQRHDFTVGLYRETDNGSRKVAESEEYPKGPVGTNQVLTEKVRTNDLLRRSVDDGSYFVRIEGPPNATHRVELVATSHRLETPTVTGSLAAPATAEHPGVIAVGAGDPSTSEPVADSGRGPTNDGRRGVDLLGPATLSGDYEFSGTSAATAYTGGLVTLLAAVNPGLSPAETAAVLTATTDRDDPTPAAGFGMVDAEASLACAETLEGRR